MREVVQRVDAVGDRAGCPHGAYGAPGPLAGTPMFRRDARRELGSES